MKPFSAWLKLHCWKLLRIPFVAARFRHIGSSKAVIAHTCMHLASTSWGCTAGPEVVLSAGVQAPGMAPLPSSCSQSLGSRQLLNECDDVLELEPLCFSVLSYLGPFLSGSHADSGRNRIRRVRNSRWAFLLLLFSFQHGLVRPQKAGLREAGCTIYANKKFRKSSLSHLWQVQGLGGGGETTLRTWVVWDGRSGLGTHVRDARDHAMIL